MSESWNDLTEGKVLGEVSLDVSETSVILVPVATWDLFPGHHSPEYARSQGQQDMYLNTIALQGVADRTVTDHLGPDAWVTRRKLTMLGSVFPGDQLAGAATVDAVRRSEPEVEADFTVEMSTPRGPALRATITARRYFTPSPPRPSPPPTVSGPPAAGHPQKGQP